MKYDFTTRHNRYSAGSFKWDLAQKLLPETHEGVIPLSVADMEFFTAPEIVEGLKKYLETTILGYGSSPDRYKEAVKAWMLERHQFEVLDEELVNTTGVVAAFFNAVRALTEAEDAVIIMPPVYYPFYAAVEAAGRELLKCPLVDKEGYYRMDFELLEELAKKDNAKAILFCNPHNPVGRAWTKEELKEIERIAIDNDLLVFSDEVHADLCLPGVKHYVLQTLSDEMAMRTVTMMAATKTFNLAGLAVSSVFIRNQDLKNRFIEGMHQAGCRPYSGLAYEATTLAYTKAGDWYEQLIDTIHENYLYLKDFLAKNLPQIVLHPLEGTYLAWMDERALGLSNEELEALHLKAGLVLDEGYIFGPEGDGYSRISLSVPKEVLIEALDRFKATVGAM